MTERVTFIASRDDKKAAYELQKACAAVLRASGQVPRLLMQVRHDKQLGWVVEMVEELPPDEEDG